MEPIPFSCNRHAQHPAFETAGRTREVRVFPAIHGVDIQDHRRFIFHLLLCISKARKAMLIQAPLPEAAADDAIKAGGSGFAGRVGFGDCLGAATMP
jgi:hypothetical protein